MVCLVQVQLLSFTEGRSSRAEIFLRRLHLPRPLGDDSCEIIGDQPASSPRGTVSVFHSFSGPSMLLLGNRFKRRENTLSAIILICRQTRNSSMRRWESGEVLKLTTFRFPDRTQSTQYHSLKSTAVNTNRKPSTNSEREAPEPRGHEPSR